MNSPNILWIFPDELRADALGCYKHPHLELSTPTIDQLAADGVLFENSFCDSPICVSSRTAIITGKHPERTGVFGNEAAWPNYPFEYHGKSLPEAFAAAGYCTASLGKTHLPNGYQPFGEYDPVGSDMRLMFNELPAEALDVITTETGGVVGGRWPDSRPYPPEQLTQAALSWLEQASSPFFLRVAYLQPHTPVITPERYRAEKESLAYQDLTQLSLTPSQFEARFAELGAGKSVPKPQLDRIQLDYYALTAWLDDQVEIILHKLDELGLRDNTIVVFSSDHGANLGEGGAFAKHIFTPQSHRVPFIISWPAKLACGERRTDVCQGLDLGPTLLKLAGLEAIDEFEGRDLFNGHQSDAVFATVGYGLETSVVQPNRKFGHWTDGTGWPRRACLRTDKYRLDMSVRRNGKPLDKEDFDVFLVNYQEDPLEQHNQADTSALQQVRDEMIERVWAHTQDKVEPEFVPVEYKRVKR
ncbi:MAG: sulfatase-like hydrolase/transferase [Pseudomonadota bacterium]